MVLSIWLRVASGGWRTLRYSGQHGGREEQPENEWLYGRKAPFEAFGVTGEGRFSGEVWGPNRMQSYKSIRGLQLPNGTCG